jgi:hypothetical protein
MPTNPKPRTAHRHLAASDLLILATTTLALLLAPSTATAGPPKNATTPIHQPPQQLPVTPVLLGLLALGLATATLTYTHTRHTRTTTRPPTTLQIKPIHQPPGRQPPIARHGANHPERQP